MPANVSFEYERAKEKFEKAVTAPEKLATLQEMQREAPKHKGGEKLRAEISKKIARLKRGIEKDREQQKKTASRETVHVKKDGPQIVLAGMPNSGKTILLQRLTNADVKPEPYPFATKKPEVGMMNYCGGRIQIVELPALIKGSASGKASGQQFLSVARNADAIALVLNGGNALEEFLTLEAEFKQANVLLNIKKPNIKSEQNADFNEISVTGGKKLKETEEELKTFLKSMGIHRASVVFGKKSNLKDVALVLYNRIAYRPAIAIVNEFYGKADGKEIAEIKKRMNLLTINSIDEKEKSVVAETLFMLLGKILVYTKKQGEEADMSEPLVLDSSATVWDIAKQLHKDFAKKFKYGRVWGSAKFSGQRVSKEFNVKNKDIVEIHC